LRCLNLDLQAGRRLQSGGGL